MGPWLVAWAGLLVLAPALVSEKTDTVSRVSSSAAAGGEIMHDVWLYEEPVQQQKSNLHWLNRSC